MIDPVIAVQAVTAQAPTVPMPVIPQSSGTPSFAEMLRQGVETTNAKLVEADRLVTAFALDDSIPAHQVTYALEQAKLSLEMMIQVRNRMIEGYQQLMNMQV